MAELAVYDNDPTLYLFTSLTAGSSHIITATSRIETILKANKIPFKGVDTATDELARKLYGRRARGKKLPLLVKEGYVIADLEQVEEWNEYDELKEALGGPSAPAPPVAVPLKAAAAQAAASTSTSKPAESAPATTSEQNLAIRQLGAEAAKIAASKKPVPEKIATTNPLLAEKVNSPAGGTPTKAGAGPASILSPRSIPLPATPATTTPKSPIPKIASKPVHAPPSMHADASNPKLAAGPISSTTTKTPTGADSSEEEDDEDDEDDEEEDEDDDDEEDEEEEDDDEDEDEDEGEEDDDEDDEEDEDEDEDDSEEEDKKGATAAGQPKKIVATVKPKADDKAEKTQAQSAKAADKAGKSVKD